MLHGYGDTHSNFINFGIKMQLPQTMIISLKAPHRVPYLPTTQWYPIFDYYANPIDSNDPQVQQELKESIDLIHDFINNNLSNYDSNRIFLLGFKQGGTLALHYSLKYKVGGIVSFGGLIQDLSSINTRTLITIDKIPKKWEKKESLSIHEMKEIIPKGRDEMMIVMKFFASCLIIGTLESIPDLIEIPQGKQ